MTPDAVGGSIGGYQPPFQRSGASDYPKSEGIASAIPWYPDIQPFDISPPEKVTPGYAEAHPKCGEVRFKVVCPENPKHHARLAKYNCHRAECPECWSGWAARAADDAASRIEGYRHATGTRYLSRHISLHPPEGFIKQGPGALQRLYSEGRKAAAVLGVAAAAVIPHHDRLVRITKDKVQEAADLAGINRYEWALSQSNWSDLVRYSPHLHLEAYGPLMDADEFHEKTGWTYRNHDGDKDSGRSGDDLTQTLYYLLTHAWVRDNHRVVRYWGGLSTHRLKRVDMGYEFKTEPCPICQCDCVKTPPDIVRWDGSIHHAYQDIKNAPIHYEKVRVYSYEVRKREKRGISARSAAVWGPAGPPIAL
jgi:hypothetical protein